MVAGGEISRRSFLKLSGLAAAGVVLGATPPEEYLNMGYRVFFSNHAYSSLLFGSPGGMERSHLVFDGTIQEYCRGFEGVYDHLGADNFNKVSTGRNGFGDAPGSGRTPLGLHEVVRVVGREYLHERYPTVFEGLIPYKDGRRRRWDGHDTEEDLILGPVLVLRGLEERNAHAFERGIYVHATNRVGELGAPASRGCVRMPYDELRWLVLEGGVEESSRVFICDDLLQYESTCPLFK
ncbi:L,D-transpeptidase family protein [Candidatus Woesearchaeota archaeon]|nr:L,D-transpeptidase family protein [Candidatus Woesearchaeota archaeon]